MNDWHFATTWCYEARIEEVAEILTEVELLSSWWPCVHISTQLVEPGKFGGVGKRVDVVLRGRIPYQLQFEYVVADADLPDMLVIDAAGLFSGRAVWKLTQEQEIVKVNLTLRVRPEHPPIRALGRLAHPIFAFNHKWMMSQGQECLCAELKRRRQHCRVSAGVC